MIAAAIAVNIGLAAGVLVPFCALCLVALVKVGINAFCAQSTLNIPINAEARKRAARRKPALPKGRVDRVT
jgi:hypothetical protein